MCKRTMYKRARIPTFFMGTLRMRQQWCPGPFFLAPAKTAWERGYCRSCVVWVPRPFYARACVFPLNRMREREKEARTGQGWNVRKGVRMQLATENGEISDAL